MFNKKTSSIKEFYFAAQTGDLTKLNSLLRSNTVNINVVDNAAGLTALHVAALYGQVDVVRLLIGKNALLTEDRSGRTPYDLTTVPEIRRILTYEGKGAVYYKKLDKPAHGTTEYLQYGYHHGSTTQAVRTQIFQCQNLDEFIDLMRVLNLTPAQYINGIPLLLLTACNLEFFILFSQYLLQNGANLNAQAHYSEHDAYQNTTLHALLSCELIEHSKEFISMVARLSPAQRLNCNIQDAEGKTVIHMGALLRRADFIRHYLLHFGTSALDIQDHLGRTALHYAFLFGDIETIECLLDYEANPHIRDRNNNTPADLLNSDEHEVRRMLLRFHIDPDRLHALNVEIEAKERDKNARANIHKKKYHARQDTPSQNPGVSVYEHCIQSRNQVKTMLVNTECFYDLYSPFEVLDDRLGAYSIGLG